MRVCASLIARLRSLMVSAHQFFSFANATCSSFFSFFALLHHALQELENFLNRCHFGGLGNRHDGNENKHETLGLLHCAYK